MPEASKSSDPPAYEVRRMSVIRAFPDGVISIDVHGVSPTMFSALLGADGARLARGDGAVAAVFLCRGLEVACFLDREAPGAERWMATPAVACATTQPPGAST